MFRKSQATPNSRRNSWCVQVGSTIPWNDIQSSVRVLIHKYPPPGIVHELPPGDQAGTAAARSSAAWPLRRGLLRRWQTDSGNGRRSPPSEFGSFRHLWLHRNSLPGRYLLALLFQSRILASHLAYMRNPEPKMGIISTEKSAKGKFAPIH